MVKHLYYHKVQGVLISEFMGCPSYCLAVCPDRPVLFWCLNTLGHKHVISFGSFDHEHMCLSVSVSAAAKL